MRIFESYNLMSSLNIVNIKNAFTVNIKTSLFMSSFEDIVKYVMLCNKKIQQMTISSKLGVFNFLT